MSRSVSLEKVEALQPLRRLKSTFYVVYYFVLCLLISLTTRLPNNDVVGVQMRLHSWLSWYKARLDAKGFFFRSSSQTYTPLAYSCCKFSRGLTIRQVVVNKAVLPLDHQEKRVNDNMVVNVGTSIFLEVET